MQQRRDGQVFPGHTAVNLVKARVIVRSIPVPFKLFSFTQNPDIRNTTVDDQNNIALLKHVESLRDARSDVLNMYIHQ